MDGKFFFLTFILEFSFQMVVYSSFLMMRVFNLLVERRPFQRYVEGQRIEGPLRQCHIAFVKHSLVQTSLETCSALVCVVVLFLTLIVK